MSKTSSYLYKSANREISQLINEKNVFATIMKSSKVYERFPKSYGFFIRCFSSIVVVIFKWTTSNDQSKRSTSTTIWLAKLWCRLWGTPIWCNKISWWRSSTKTPCYIYSAKWCHSEQSQVDMFLDFYVRKTLEASFLYFYSYPIPGGLSNYSRSKLHKIFVESTNIPYFSFRF